MSKKPKKNNNRDMFTWVGFFAIWIVAFVLQAFLHTIPAAFLVIGWLIIISSSLALAATTTQGLLALEFIKSGREELLKVVWPTRKEATQITFIVIAVVLVVGLLLWGIDSIMVWAIAHLTQIKQ